MSNIKKAFKPGRPALIGYVTVGYPSLDATIKAVTVLEEAGCDIVELGIPFSDPLADGVTIQRASHQALVSGVTPIVCLQTAARIRKQVKIPLLFMTYYNPVLKFNQEMFCLASSKAGIDGLIIPDLPPEEGTLLEDACFAKGLELVYLLAPNSTEERVALVAQHSRGFIYLVSLTGVTGTRDGLSADLSGFVSNVRRYAKQPLCLGFGVSTPEQARQFGKLADGVIVGSRLIQLMEEDTSLKSLREFVDSLRKALDKS